VHVSLAPTWFDPAETQGIITPFLIMYAIHDAMVKAMPGNAAAPSLAESWQMSPDGRTYDFTLRKGLRFHNGDALTSEDVKFSFERYRGTSAKQIKERVAAVETPGPLQVRFRLKNPWPDFMTFYTAASGAGWIVPKKYVEKVGDDGYKKAPVGAGPYKFVSFTPGVELVMDAFEGYWRKTPHVKRLVFKVIGDEATRLAALKRGEIDVVYSIRGELAEELQRTPGLTLKPAVIQAPQWVAMLDQWDPKSPWHDRRVRLAANLAIDRKGRIWFTNPVNEGNWDKTEVKELDNQSVLRADPQKDGSYKVTRVTFDTTQPNGILVSQDQGTLYVAESSYTRGVARELRAYPIREDGSLGAFKTLHTWGEDARDVHRGIDGMCLDRDGNIVATNGWELSGPGPMITVFAPSGRVLETHPVPANRPTNCCFGGPDLRTLFVTEGMPGRVLAFEGMSTAGLPVHRVPLP